MSAYMYITFSLILYPLAGYFLIRLTKSSLSFRKMILGALASASLLIITCIITNTITISQNLNWFLVTFIYLTFSVLLWLTQTRNNIPVKYIGKFIIIISFGFGYVIATIGFFFVMIAANELDTDQKIWLTENLIYTERNIGQGPDPSVREKEVEVYKKVNWLPLIATRIKTKTYDEWYTPLQKNLDVSYSKERQLLYLNSVVQGYKTFTWADTISLSK